jgi:glycosyltransferase involved in cell wall biosynthesis
MRIVVNTQLLLKDRLEGLGVFTHEILKRITQNHPEHEFVFIFDRPWDEQFIYSNNIIPVKTYLQSRHPLLWYLRFQYQIPRIAKKFRADLFLSTDGWSITDPQINTFNVIHDIEFVHRPKNIPFLMRTYLNHFFEKSARQSIGLATVSEFSKNDMIKAWNIPADKIEVVYNGSNEIYKPLSSSDKDLTIQEITQGMPYFIYVGSLNPRKNIDGMMLAFDRFKQKNQLPHKLVIVGKKMRHEQSAKHVYEKLVSKSDILFIGRQPAELLHKILASAEALVLVSHLEGFGIPIIEAMNCDVPVICSNCTAMPEIAGNAAHLVDPNDIESIAHGYEKLATDPNYRNQLIANGRVQRNKFNWDNSAKKLWAGIEKCLHP